ncbi:hypothetical protein CONLIGDRAFT_177820 [Coniochaeta ligniaria NRRL 30616]|uniref:Uncharacterized protein n=1 Tax=Coniochaeta ligniaria NRRL 30616 TaxID=1408157 RepID=A0A1J7JVK1_9PEZI|nr:hypothetical protein CONLIGDRAFT_177820 [Coniochaeta ligniaria NRRL 30616]
MGTGCAASSNKLTTKWTSRLSNSGPLAVHYGPPSLLTPLGRAVSLPVLLFYLIRLSYTASLADGKRRQAKVVRVVYQETLDEGTWGLKGRCGRRPWNTKDCWPPICHTGLYHLLLILPFVLLHKWKEYLGPGPGPSQVRSVVVHGCASLPSHWHVSVDRRRYTLLYSPDPSQPLFFLLLYLSLPWSNLCFACP